MSFLPDVEKVLAVAKKKTTQLEQLDFLFKTLEKDTNQKICRYSAKELSSEQRNNWCRFYGLKVIAIPTLKGITKTRSFSTDINIQTIPKRRRHNECLT